MSRQSMARLGVYCHDRVFLGCDRVWATWGEFMSRTSSLRRDRKSQDIRFPCRDIVLYVMTVGVRHCVANKAGRMRDRGALSPTIDPSAHNGHAHVNGMRA